ncbi:PAS domain S-box protein [Massilia suwonensis]|uniref:histidine kinase n=1 Tax=Massilia suwonensis TaxID=648895 RepID=A0ABW0MJZ6_9BURK
MNKQQSRTGFLDNGGAIGRRIRSRDWSQHPLGPVEDWDAALRTSLGIVLSSSFPTFLAWGEELTLFFNDPYEPMLGQKTGCLGAPYPAVWHEVWDSLGPYVRRVLAGESFFFENYEVRLERHGYPEQTWFTFSYSPLRDDQGAVRGLICTCVEVTDKVQALARHKEAEERLALSLEASGNIGTWSYDLDGGATHVDERFARLFQVDAALAREGTELERFTDMIHPEDRPRVVAAIATAIREDSRYDIDYRIPQRAGHDVWVNARGKVFADPASGRRRFAGIAVDISARKTAEARAEAASARAEDSRRRLDALLEAAPVGIAYADTEGRFLMTNAANRAIWGDYMPADGVAGYGAWRGWAEDGGAPLSPADWPTARVLAGEEHHEAVLEIEPVGVPGVRKTLLVRAQRMLDAAGTLVGAVAATMDITAQVQAERALKESEQKFRSIANVIPQMVWSTNVEGTEHYVNERWHEYTGIADPNPSYKVWRAVVHPDDQAPVLAAWHRSFDDNTPFEAEHRLAHHGGGYRWVLNRALPSFDEHGRASHWIGTLTDIHEQKAGTEELRAASRRKDEFLAMLAHELRNPLAPISNAAQLLTMAGSNEARVRQSSDVIIRQVRHMTALVDDLLDVSRVTRGLVTLEREPVDIDTVVAGAIEQARPLIEARGHRFVLKQEAPGVRILGDRTRLVQVLSNLLNNAAKYTPQGGSIALNVARRGAGVAITVRDDGIGIAPGMLPHVFDLFSQAERTPDRSQGGLGLGLALVKSLVQLHGGRVEAHSAGLGRGSSFGVVFDLLDTPAPARAAHSDAGAVPQTQAGPARRRVLVVDDNADAAQSLAEVLGALGHAVATRNSSAAGLAAAVADWPEVFILDIGLPDIDGYELVRRLRALQGERAARYIALTGYGQAHDKVLARGAGFDHHFVKPVDLAALCAVLDENVSFNAGAQAPAPNNP